MFSLEQRLELEAERELDRFASGTCRSDDDDATGRRLGCEKCLGIEREGMVARGTHYGNIGGGTRTKSLSELPSVGRWRPV